MDDTLDARRRLALAQLLLGPELAGLPPATRDRALLIVLGTPDAQPSSGELADWLTEYHQPDTDEAARRLRAVELEKALAARLARLPIFAPCEWAPPVDTGRALGEALTLQADHVLLEAWGPRVPEARRAVAEALQQRLTVLTVDALGLLADPRALLAEALVRDRPEPVATVLRELHTTLPPSALAHAAAQFRSASDETLQESWLHELLAWPTPDVAPVLRAVCTERWAQDRAAAVLTQRFGKRFGHEWGMWSEWLARQAPASLADRLRALHLEPELLLLLLTHAPQAPIPALPEPLAEWARLQMIPARAEHFLERWGELIPAAEARAIAAAGVALAVPEERREPLPVAPVEPEDGVLAPQEDPAAFAAASLPSSAETPGVEAPASAEHAPPVSREPARAVAQAADSAAHLPGVPAPVVAPAPPPAGPDPWRGFLAENANLFAGIALLLAGGSLIAYFTWDRHWLFRYTLVPGLFAVFTAGLAAVAGWLERSDPTLAGTAAMLRGAAIALLPANCMSVSLLADDAAVTHKLVAVPAMAVLYVVLLTIGLRGWCGAVHPALRRSLAPGLLCLNALVLVRPLARALARLDDFAVLDVLTIGFYAGFVVVAEVLRRLVTRVLTREIAQQPRIAWFAGGLVVITYLQVFVWAHAWERALPPLAAYGALIVLTGGLAFWVERRFRLVLGLADGAGEESFIGFTLILVGLLAGFGNPLLRIVCFTLAGLLWIYQARFRESPLHDYVGLLLLALGGASVALLPTFPRVLLSGLGLGLALGLGLTAGIAARAGVVRLREAADALQQALLVLTTLVAALAQWHYRSEPLGTAAVLGLVVAVLMARGRRHDGIRDVFIGAMVAALVLPYLGFVDMRGQHFAGNTLVLGLAWLSLMWLAAVGTSRAPVLVSLRSTVLFLYGAFAVAAMAARVLVERQMAAAPSLALSWPEFAGPLLMLAVLVATTWNARSMLPMLGGLLIVVAMLPALKANFQLLFPTLAWGTGFGSAVIALLLLAVSFYFRDAPALAALGEGDRFFGERFPLQRRDHTLFTLPLLGTVLFLLVRVDTWSVLRNLEHGPPLKTSAAVLVSALSWTLVGVWLRSRSSGSLAVHAGFVALLAGLLLGKRQWGDPSAFEWPLLLAGVVLQLAEIGYRTLLVPRHAWARALLADSTRRVLRGASVLVAAALVVLLFQGHAAPQLRLLGLFVLAELVRHALRKDALPEGALALGLVLTALLAETAPGTEALLLRLDWSHSVWPLLGFATVVHAVVAALEPRAAVARRVFAVLAPARVAAALVTWSLGAIVVASATGGPRLSLPQLALVVANALLLARAVLPGPSLLLAALAAYVGVLQPWVLHAPSDHARARVLLDPVSLALFALALAALVAALRRGPAALHRWWPSPLAVAPLRTEVVPWMLLPAWGAALLATLRHSLLPDLRALSSELPAPYLAAAALVVLAWQLDSVAAAWTAAVALTLGNVHGVRLLAGDLLRAHGLSEVHLLALGVTATLSQGALVRLAVRGRAANLLRQVTLAAAALVLVLLSGNYAADPDLQDITPFRFVVSGLMALGAGLFFRRAAVRPEPDEERYVGFAYAVYHFGVAMALWCLVLLVPLFRHPVAALPGLALPVLYFYLVAERFARLRDARAVRYARSAVVLASIVLALYAARPLFQFVLFPEATVRTDHYNSNAPLVIVLGLALVRLHAFEARFLVALLGGVAVMTGTYFGLTGWSALSPFSTRFPAAWAAIALAHAFTWLVRRPGRVRAAAQRLGAIADEDWERLGLGWHLAAFVGALDLALIAVSHPDVLRFGWGALLGGVLGILLHDPRMRRLSFAVALFLAAGLGEAAQRPELGSELALLVVALCALRMLPGPFALIAWLDVYLLAQHVQLVTLEGWDARFTVLSSPWRVGALGLALALTVELSRHARKRQAWLSGSSTEPLPAGAAEPPSHPQKASLEPWLGTPAAVLTVLAALQHTLVPDLRHARVQLWAPVLGAATHAALALTPPFALLAWSAALLLALADVHVVHHFAGRTLLAHGVGLLDQVALGVGLTLLFTRALGQWTWSALSAARLARIRATLALVALTLLVASYVWNGGFASFEAWRGVLSGLVALAAADALRSLAHEADAPGLRTLYHVALSAAILAFALALPLLRTPRLALATLALPAFYLWARSELASALDARSGARYRDSATAASAIVLACYLSRTAFRATLFPDLEISTRHWHTHAAVVLVLGVLLLRLHRLGAPFASAVAGGLAVLGASYFVVTAGPGLSPFAHPLPAAWVAIAMLHAWTLVSAPSSSITALVRAFAGLDEGPWQRLRTTLGEAALLATHLVALSALAHPGVLSHAMAPLLCGTASLLVHHGLIRASGIYFDAAVLELLVALHADALVPSDLSLEHVIWVLLAARAVLVAVCLRPRPAWVQARVEAWGTVCACLVLAHVFHQRPWSEAALVATLLLALVTALVPRLAPVAGNAAERVVVFLLLAVPTWIVHFTSAPWAELGPRAVVVTEPLLRTLLAIFLTGLAAESLPIWAGTPGRARLRALHQVLSFLETSGAALSGVVLHAVSAACIALLVAHYGRPYSAPELVLALLLFGALSASWYRRGRRRASWLDVLVAEAFAGAAFGLLRRQLLLTTALWTYEYDLWVSLAASALFTGAKQRLDRGPGARELQRPVTLSVLLMPALAFFWALSHQLGSDMVLLVVGLNTVLFAFLGQDRRSSPYNLVAVTGFVAFVLVVFWSKLELRVVHAYVLPVGIGVLLLLQLFERELTPAARARIRLVCLSAMLASSGWSALLDARYPVAFNLTLLLLALGCMAVGSLLRIRLYVALGLASLLLDLVSLSVKALAHMESQARMTWVGFVVFLLGGLLVAGGVYQKTKSREIEERWARLRAAWDAWQ